MNHRSFLSKLAILATLAAVYLVAGKLGLKLAFVHQSATAVWPPAGIALGAFLILGYDVWPSILLGAFFVNLTTEGTILTSLGIALGNTLEGLIGAYFVNRFAGGRKALIRAPDVFKFAVLAGTLSTTVSATIGVATLCLGGLAGWDKFGPIWLTWWLGDAVGDLVVAPVIVLWGVEPRLHWTRWQALEACGLVASLWLVAEAV